MKEEIKDRETINYLEGILKRRAFISNPTRLDIPGFGEVIATSMVSHHFGTIPYFRFENGKQKGEFFEEDGKYFIQYDITLEVEKAK